MKREYSAQERATLIAWLLAEGEALTTEQIADICQMTVSGAWKMMQHVSRVAAICFVDRKWQRIENLHN